MVNRGFCEEYVIEGMEEFRSMVEIASKVMYGDTVVEKLHWACRLSEWLYED